MAITILSTPQTVQPVYNPIYIRTSSDETSQEAFSFIYDLYVNGSFVNRDRLLSRPGTSEAIYSPARILESYVSFDKYHNISGVHPSQEAIDKYEIVVGEEWVNYWEYYDNSSVGGSLSGYTQLYTITGATNDFAVGDKVYVQQTSGYTSSSYNGVFTVLSASSTSIVIDVPHTTTPVNGGTVTYSDKRKTIYTGSTPAVLLSSTSGWTGVGVYTGTSITSTYQGQQYYDSNYYFVAVNDNDWIRMARV